ncbi:GNAT family N-acetyltransferase [Actinopolymorpha pittospori]|jgi:GNAT superfamily N-acetyltransferase|uniref:GNAT superfamily N-acetyltransferase n=1 Tax=Actinopolymorpha pittospori TaxID=648752 RepID=A0A927R859_9ACTN|nr:GNAT family N-acetyltransferase [Actinopolymorpha pittospori]MBE1604999.1 GNAT superfamily N-acetyltransferase [Actinopolymorpha pittospori]
MSTTRRLVNVTLDNLDDLPRPCRRCVFWELDPVARQRAEDAGDPALEKEAWLSATLLDWGSCGKVCYVGDVLAAFALYAPPSYVPRSVAFPTSPVSADAVLLMTVRVLPDFAGGGLGRVMIQSVAKDLLKRGVRAVEVFGDAKWERPGCVVPAEFLLSVGFKTVRPHHRYPRLRIDLRNVLTWKEDVEAALEKLIDSMTPEGVPHPA